MKNPAGTEYKAVNKRRWRLTLKIVLWLPHPCMTSEHLHSRMWIHTYRHTQEYLRKITGMMLSYLLVKIVNIMCVPINKILSVMQKSIRDIFHSNVLHSGWLSRWLRSQLHVTIANDWYVHKRSWQMRRVALVHTLISLVETNILGKCIKGLEFETILA